MSSPAGSPFPAGGRGRGLGAAAVLILFIALSAYVATMLIGIELLTGPGSREQIAWAPSPDGRTHAILIETNGGATTPFGYLVELHPADHQGQAPVQAASLTSASTQCARGVGLRWLDAQTLALRFVSARDVLPEPSVTVGGRTIRIVAQRVAKNPAIVCD